MPEKYSSDIAERINSGVLIGEDHFLFLWQGAQKQFDYLTGASKPSKASIANFSHNIQSRKSFLDKHGIEYRHIVFPSKPTVYEDKLPCGIKVKSIFETHYEKNQCVFYPRKRLLTQRLNHKETFRTIDTHLTDYGFLACMKEVLQDEFRLLGQCGYTFKGSKKMVAGDLACMINKEEPTTLPEFFFKAFDQYKANIEYELSDNINDIPGNTGNIAIYHSLNSLKKQRLLIFGDSFIRKGLHLLTPIYSEIIYFRSQFFRHELVNIFRPDMVITANAERYLSNVQSDEETEYWCASNFKRSTTLIQHENSTRLLFHLRGLSSRYFRDAKYQAYLFETARFIRAKDNSGDLPCEQWFSQPRWQSISQHIVGKLDSQDIDSFIRVELKPARQTSPSNGSIRSLATHVYQGQIDSIHRSPSVAHKLLAHYDKKTLFILCLLRLEFILDRSEALSLSNFEASELYYTCSILSELMKSKDQSVREWIDNTIDSVLSRDSMICLAELFKACYLLRPYLTVLKKALPNLASSFESRDQRAIKSYFFEVNKSDIASQDFIDLIKAKSVAIVGPSSCGQSLGKEIDSFDTVIRMSVDDLSDLEESVSGMKTSIVYFSGHTANSQDRIISLAESVPCISVSLPKFAPLLFKRSRNAFEPKYSHIRQAISLNHVRKLLLYTSPNLLQVILLDILRYDPARVKIFYSNMFAKQTYDSNYKSAASLRKRSGRKQKCSISSLTMVNHDPISNFSLVKTLYNSMLFEADPILNEVLNMGAEEYLDSLISNVVIPQ